jgi:O-antigen/teichoic acid export membrane protein
VIFIGEYAWVHGRGGKEIFIQSHSMSNTRRIAKNTLMLYFRQILIMVVSLYTVRAVLNTLGAEDYGIYTVVAGVVAMFGFINASLASGSQRFFAFEIGRGDLVRLRQVFSVTFIIYLMMVALVFLLAETAGLWFVNSKMTIPAGRLPAATWVYQSSVCSFALNIIATPFNASIMAHERMSFYAYISILESLLRLAAVFFLTLLSFDKLKLYAVLLTVITVITTLVRILYCRIRFKECSCFFYWEKELAASLFSYSGYNMIGSVANVARVNGIDVLLNIFFGPVVNAARGVAVQILHALSMFVTNLYAASKPQITKYYAVNDERSMWKLVFGSTKFAYFLILILAVPLLVEIEFILSVWLHTVPQFTPIFVRLIVIGFMIESLTSQLVSVLQAANKIKRFELSVATILLLNIPVSYVALRNGSSPFFPFIISIVLTVLCIIPRIIIEKKEVDLPLLDFSKNTVRLLFVTFLTFIVPLFIYKNVNFGLNRFILISVSGFFISVLFIWTIGLQKTERNMVIAHIQRRFWGK